MFCFGRQVVGLLANAFMVGGEAMKEVASFVVCRLHEERCTRHVNYEAREAGGT